jgi:hypothetical protein
MLHLLCDGSMIQQGKHFSAVSRSSCVPAHNTWLQWLSASLRVLMHKAHQPQKLLALCCLAVSLASLLVLWLVQAGLTTGSIISECQNQFRDIVTSETASTGS